VERDISYYFRLTHRPRLPRKAVDPLHGAGIDREPLGDLTHARAPRRRPGLPNARLSEANRVCFPRAWAALGPSSHSPLLVRLALHRSPAEFDTWVLRQRTPSRFQVVGWRLKRANNGL